jgi:hypothetical protein
MLHPEARGRGREGVLAAVGVGQPVYTGLGWLRARTEPSATKKWHDLWAEVAVVRARFVRGSLGSVLREDLHLYLDAFARDLPTALSSTAHRALAILERGAVTTDRLQADLGVTRSELRRALSDLGLRGMVMEAPRDTWHLTGWEGPVPGSERQLRARAEIVRRSLSTYGPATLREVADRFAWPRAQVRRALEFLPDGTVTQCTVESDPDKRYVCLADIDGVRDAELVQPFVCVLDFADPFVLAQRMHLTQRFGYGAAIPAYWAYVLVTGEWLGALRIHYKTRLLWIEDLYLDEGILADEQLTRMAFEEIRRSEAKPVRIDRLNGVPAHYPINREILSEQGYRVDTGMASIG